MRGAPAALPALLFVVVCGATPSLRPTPSWTILGLTAGGVALGNGAGIAALAAAAGLWLGEGRRVEEPPPPRGLVAELEGTICGPWRSRKGFASVTARLCPGWMRIGRRVLVHSQRLYLDLPSAADRPPLGSRVVARGTLSQFPGLANATPTAPGPWRLRLKAGVFLRVTARPGRFARVSEAVRCRVERAIQVSGSGVRPGIALTRALVLGDESGFDDELRRALRRVGLAHLFVVSGFNLTVVAAFAALIAGFGPRIGGVVLPGVGIVLYLAVVGPEPSMLRASIVAVLGLAVLTLRRSGSPLQALALAAVALVVSQPGIVDDLGFRLSFGATAGLVLGAGDRIEPLRLVPRPIATAVMASLTAQLGALPFVVAAFGEVSPLAPLANLVAVPWAACWLLAGMAWLVVAVAVPGWARSLSPILDLGAAPFDWVQRVPASLWTSVAIESRLGAGLLLSGAITLVLVRRRGRRSVPLLLLALASTGGPSRSTATQEVTFLDVGQGDATLLRNEDFAVLIDGGGLIGRDLGATVLRPALHSRGIQAVDVAVLSHSDRDHCQGLVDLAATVPILEVWTSEGQLNTNCARRLSARIHGGARIVAAGQRIERYGVRFTFLHPEPGSAPSTANAESLAFVVELGERRFLFGGDLGAREERRIAARYGEDLTSGVLKVSHHGASRSTADEWLVRARPRWAVVTVGKPNAYGHPSLSTLDRLARFSIRVLRTDRDGQITFIRAGGGAWRLSLPGTPRQTPPEG